MSLFVVRVWLPDRPGALGLVASRIGAVGADVVGIDILERGGGRAVDELTIDLEDPSHIDILTSEISQVDGVDVEYVRPSRSAFSDRAIEAIDISLAIMRLADPPAQLEALVAGCVHLFDADWAAVVRPSDGACLAIAGEDAVPSTEWLAAFVVGAGSGEGSLVVEDLARSSVASFEAELVVARGHLPLRQAERRIMEKLTDAFERPVAPTRP